MNEFHCANCNAIVGSNEADEEPCLCYECHMTLAYWLDWSEDFKVSLEEGIKTSKGVLTPALISYYRS